ncbi:MAG: DUF1669 domain-containing protein [Bdellovibrionaceae bacterium]|nr:DUF1669 domain-containing protein [Pseudobdellovibrionaceae bacterium]
MRLFGILVTTFLMSSAFAVQNLQTCFSPEDNCDKVILEYVAGAAKTIDIAIFNLSMDELHVALTEAKARGVKVRIVCDRNQATNVNSEIKAMITEGFDIRYGTQKGLMHNKFMIVDDTWVETGSYNYTFTASHLNSENQIYLNDSAVVDRYQKDFLKVWATAAQP